MLSNKFTKMKLCLDNGPAENTDDANNTEAAFQQLIALTGQQLDNI